jgi:hypothetical protein
MAKTLLPFKWWPPNDSFFLWWKRETCCMMCHMYHTYICDHFRHLKSTRFDYLQSIVWMKILVISLLFIFRSHLIQDVIISILNNHHNINIVCSILSTWDFPNHNASRCALGMFGKLLMSKGALFWFETIWSFNVQVIDYWIIFSVDN